MLLAHLLVKAGMRKVGWGQFLGQGYVLFPPSHKVRHFVTYWEVVRDALHVFFTLCWIIYPCHSYQKPHHCSHRLNLSGQVTLYFMCHFPWLHNKTVSFLKFSFILICLAPTTMSGTVIIRHVIATQISTQNVICKSSRAWPWQTTKCFWSSVFSFVKWETVHTYPNTYIELCEIPSQSMHSISRTMTHY